MKEAQLELAKGTSARVEQLTTLKQEQETLKLKRQEREELLDMYTCLPARYRTTSAGTGKGDCLLRAPAGQFERKTSELRYDTIQTLEKKFQPHFEGTDAKRQAQMD